jgi:hypothetical protein
MTGKLVRPGSGFVLRHSFVIRHSSFVIPLMSEPASNAELMRSLGRLVRGLSALFWGLPITLIVCFYTAKVESLRSLGIGPPLLTTGLLGFGLWQLGDFQKQERVWRGALDRARVLNMINFFLSPFLYWWNKIPANAFFFIMVLVMTFSALLFLGSLNVVLRRLGAMLPDEALRLETRQFTALNLNLLLVTFLFALIYLVLGEVHSLPRWLGIIVSTLDHGFFWFLILLVLLPLAMTMALLWKTKEVILDNVFGASRPE